MYPAIAHLQALFTASGVRFEVTNLIEMGTLSHVLLPWAVAAEAALENKSGRAGNQK